MGFKDWQLKPTKFETNNEHNSYADYFKKHSGSLEDVLNEVENKKRKGFFGLKNFFSANKKNDDKIKFEKHPSKLQDTPHNPDAQGYVPNIKQEKHVGYSEPLTPIGNNEEIKKVNQVNQVNQVKKVKKNIESNIKKLSQLDQDPVSKNYNPFKKIKNSFDGLKNSDSFKNYFKNPFKKKNDEYGFESELNTFDHKRANKLTAFLLGSAIFFNAVYLNSDEIFSRFNKEVPVKEVTFLKPEIACDKHQPIKALTEDDFKRVADIGVNINKDYDLDKLLKAGHKTGLTGVLKTISSDKPDYTQGGNIQALAELAGIDLFDEDIVAERKVVNSIYIGNGINDILVEDDVVKIYEVLSKQNTNNSKTHQTANNAENQNRTQNNDADSNASLSSDLKSYNSKKADISDYVATSKTEIVAKTKFELKDKTGEFMNNLVSGLTTGLTNDDYKTIAVTFNSAKNKFKALEEIMTSYALTEVVAAKEVFNSRKQESVSSIKYSTFLKNEFSSQEVASLLESYVNGTIRKTKEVYNEVSKVDVSTNFYKALDDFSEIAGLGKIRKAKMSAEDKVCVLDKIRAYASSISSKKSYRA